MNHAKRLPLREQKKQDTRRRIKEASSQLFLQRGFDQTTIDAIAAAAQISKPTFFNYFASKQHVLAELMTRMDEEFIRYIRHAVAQGQSTKDRLSRLMSQAAEHIKKRPEYTRLLLVEGMSDLGDPNIETSRMAQLNRAMAELVERGRQEHDISLRFSVDLQVQILVGGFLYGLLNWLSGDPRKLQHSLEETAQFLAEALAPPTQR
jgi:AcrR family transcriptional regulator